MEKMEIQNSQPKAVATYNEEKFYAIAQKVAGDLCIPQEEIPIVKQKAMSFYLAFKQTANAKVLKQGRHQGGAAGPRATPTPRPPSRCNNM